MMHGCLNWKFCELLIFKQPKCYLSDIRLQSPCILMFWPTYPYIFFNLRGSISLHSVFIHILTHKQPFKALAWHREQFRLQYVFQDQSVFLLVCIIGFLTVESHATLDTTQAKTGQTQCFSIDPPSLERRFSSQKRPLPSGEE